MSTGKNLALVVGVNSGPNSSPSPLKHAVRDALSMANVLRQSYCNFELPEENLFLEERAESRDIQRKIISLARNCSVDDMLLFYFCGHGIPMPVDTEDQDIYLCTTDFNQEEVRSQKDFHISFNWLREHLYENCKAGSILLILDCCYSGEFGKTGPDNYLLSLKKSINKYFGTSGDSQRVTTSGLRQTLAATGHIDSIDGAPASDGIYSPTMTELIVPAIAGEIEDAQDPSGQVTIATICAYLEHIQKNLSPNRKASLSGDSAGQAFVLATHPLNMKKQESHQQEIHIPIARSSHPFQERTNEFNNLQQLMFNSGSPVHLGLVGIAGIGKSQLACEVAYRFKDHFQHGIFWFDASEKSVIEWQGHLARIAKNVRYLLPDFDSHSDNDEYAARCFCKYLIAHPQALLIADNVVDPRMFLSNMQQIANDELTCALIYTSQSPTFVDGFQKYEVAGLDNEAAQKFLLTGIRDREVDVVLPLQKIIDRCYHHPLTLVHVRAYLQDNRAMALQRMAQILEEEGPWQFDRRGEINVSLNRALQAQIDSIRLQDAQTLFYLAVCFPSENAIPLELIGLASGLGEQAESGQLADAWLELERISLVSYDPKIHQLHFHSLIYAFGQRQLQERKQQYVSLFSEAAIRLKSAFEDLQWLEKKARKSYKSCIGYIQQAILYSTALDQSLKDPLKFVESLLIQEREAIEKNDLRLKPKSGFFYQQLFNSAVQRKQPFKKQESTYPWLRLVQPVIPEVPKPLKRFVVQRDRENVDSRSLKITSVAFSPDSSKVLLGVYEEGEEQIDYKPKPVVSFAEAWILDAITGEKLVLLEKEHEQEITQAIFSPDGMYVLTSSIDTTVRLWDAETGEQIHSFEGYASAITCMVFSSDGSQFALALEDFTIQLWNINDKCQSVPPFYGHQDEITCLAFSPDNTYIISGSLDSTARLWSTSTGESLAIYTGHQAGILDVAFSPNGAWVLTGSQDHTARLWDTRTATFLKGFRGHTDHVAKVAAFENEPFIVTASFDGTFRSWHPKLKDPLSILRYMSQGFKDASIANNGKYLLMVTKGGSVELWNLSDDTKQKVAPEDEAIKEDIEKIALSSNESILISIHKDKNAFLWNINLENTSYKKNTLEYNYLCAVFHSNDYLALGGADGTLAIFDDKLFDDAPLFTLNCNNLLDALYESEEGASANNGISIIAFTFSGDNALIGFEDGRLGLWILKKGRDDPLITYLGHTNKICGLIISPDEKYFVSGAQDGTALLWKLERDGRLHTKSDPVRSFNCNGADSIAQLVSLALVPNNTAILTSATLQSVSKNLSIEKTQTRIWNIATDTWKEFPEGHKSAIHVFSFSPNGQLLLTCDNEGEVRLWCVESAFDYRLTGIYNTTYPVKVARWLDEKRFLLVDTGGYHHRPRFHYLEVEGLLEKG